MFESDEAIVGLMVVVVRTGTKVELETLLSSPPPPPPPLAPTVRTTVLTCCSCEVGVAPVEVFSASPVPVVEVVGEPPHVVVVCIGGVEGMGLYVPVTGSRR